MADRAGMRKVDLLRTLVIVALATMTGCATVPMVMSLHPDTRSIDLGWPAPPETRRLQYAGMLIGEANFAADPNAPPAGAGQRFIKWIVGLTGQEPESKRLLRPQTGLVDPAGRILVTDAGRQGVVVFDPVAGRLDIWRQATGAYRFDTPVGIAAAGDGSVLVADAALGLIVRLDSGGDPLGVIDAPDLERPTGLAVDPVSGKLFVADTGRHDIKVFSSSGKLLDTLGQRGTAPGEFNGPTHLHLRDQKLYVADTLNTRVQVLTLDGLPVGSVGKRGLYLGNMVRPKGVTTDSDHHLYVVESEHDYLLVYDDQSRFLLPVGGNGAGIGQFFLPAGAWSDDRDRIYVADMFNGRVMVFQYLGDGP